LINDLGSFLLQRFLTTSILIKVMSTTNTSNDKLSQVVTEGSRNRSILFMDAAVENYSSLVAGVLPGFEAIILDSTQDGVQQITQVLSQRQNLASVHIVSHGSCGSVQLGTANLSWDTLSFYASQLQSWQNALTDAAQILLYGCNVAAGAVGKAFVQRLSELTSAVVAASDDLTGNAALGGDWELEVQAGSAGVTLAFSSAVMESYTSVLISEPYLVYEDEPFLALDSLFRVGDSVYFERTYFSTTYLYRIDTKTGTTASVRLGASGEEYQGTGINNIILDDTLYVVKRNFTTPDWIDNIFRIDNTNGTAVSVLPTLPNTEGWRIIPFGSLTTRDNAIYIRYLYIGESDELSSEWLLKIDNTKDQFVVPETQYGEQSVFGIPIEFDGFVYFISDNNNNQGNLWRVDNTTNQPIQLTDTSGAGYSFNSTLAKVNGNFYFIANNSSTGQELWKITNTTNNPVLVADINPGTGSSSPSLFAYVGNTLYFTADDGTHGKELWKINPSTGNPVLVTDINPGAGSVSLSNYIDINGTLYFSANDGVRGYELWKIDGNTGQAVLVRDIKSGSGSSNPRLLTNVNGKLYFIADHTTYGTEL
jgi:ELWxxDGT repeat protein